MAKTPLQHAEANHHVVKTSTSLFVLVALAGLMALTIAISYVDLGAPWVNNVVAMVIASTKAWLVMMFFMGLKWSTSLTRLWAAAGFVCFTLMFIILFDYNTRSFEIAPNFGSMEETATPRVVDPEKAHRQLTPNEGGGLRPRG